MMMMRAFTIASALATSTLAAVVPSNGTAASATPLPAYIAYVWNETAPEIHGKPIQSTYTQFRIGGEPTAVCEYEHADCPSKNITIFTGPDNNNGFWLGTLSGGQQLYIDLPEILLSALAKQEKIEWLLPTWAEVKPFTVELDDFSNQTVLRYNGNDFVACPYRFIDTLEIRPLSFGDAAYARPVDHGPCYPFKMRLEETNAAAVDYYD